MPTDTRLRRLSGRLRLAGRRVPRSGSGAGLGRGVSGARLRSPAPIGSSAVECWITCRMGPDPGPRSSVCSSGTPSIRSDSSRRSTGWYATVSSWRTGTTRSTCPGERPDRPRFRSQHTARDPRGPVLLLSGRLAGTVPTTRGTVLNVTFYGVRIDAMLRGRVHALQEGEARVRGARRSRSVSDHPRPGDGTACLRSRAHPTRHGRSRRRTVERAPRCSPTCTGTTSRGPPSSHLC